MDRRLLATGVALLTALGTAAPALAAGLDRTLIPKAGALRPFHFPDWQEAKLSNGQKVILVENHRNPVVSCMLLLKGGADTDPVGKSGRAALAATVWTSGTPTRKAAGIDETVESYGATLAAGADRAETSIGLKTPSEHFAALLPVFADVALHPTVPADELKQEQALMVTELKQAEDKVGDLAKRMLNRTLFPNHPYGESVQGSIAGVSALTRADVQGFFSQQLTPANSLIVVAGDISPKTLMPQLEALFGKTKPGKPVALTLTVPKAVAKPGLIVIDKPGAVQSAVRIGTHGLTDRDVDAPAWAVANAIFGGLFTSRLNANLRENKGYTYGASSSYSHWQLPGYVMAGANVETKFTVPSVAEMLKEIALMRDKPLTAAELAKAKAYLIGTFPNQFDTAQAVGDTVAELNLLGLPASHVRQYRERIARITAADVQRVSKRFLSPAHLVIVVAGDAASLKGIEAFGPVTRVPAKATVAHP